MAGSGRKRLIRIVERVAIGLVILDVVIYLAVLQPIRGRTQAKFEDAKEKRLEILNEETRVKQLDWYKKALPATQNDLDDFMSNDVQSKRKSYSRSTKLVRGLAQDTGVEMDSGGMTYHMEALANAPLDRMTLAITAKGPFDNLLNFAHSLETTSDDFLILRDFSFDSSEREGLTLHLTADLYLTR